MSGRKVFQIDLLGRAALSSARRGFATTTVRATMRRGGDTAPYLSSSLHLRRLRLTGHAVGMDRATAIREIRENVLQIGTHVTAIHPRVPGLDDAATQSEIV